jgi:hypothetical protein
VRRRYPTSTRPRCVTCGSSAWRRTLTLTLTPFAYTRAPPGAASLPDFHPATLCDVWQQRVEADPNPNPNPIRLHTPPGAASLPDFHPATLCDVWQQRVEAVREATGADRGAVLHAFVRERALGGAPSCEFEGPFSNPC